jgi:hypothetical protein
LKATFYKKGQLCVELARKNNKHLLDFSTFHSLAVGLFAVVNNTQGNKECQWPKYYSEYLAAM